MMATTHVIQDGDCISSVGFKYGFFPDTIWDHPKNEALRKQRTSKNVLSPGDNVFIPDKQPKEVDKPDGQRHRFRRKGVPEVLAIRFLDADDRPRSGLPYSLNLDGRIRKGETDAEGFLREFISPDAMDGKLVIGKPGAQKVLDLDLGRLPPITQVVGIQARLNNLGYRTGQEKGTLGEKTRAALKKFQTHYDLPVTGEPDRATLDKLRERHRS